ncbi:MAG: HAD family hydrolase [Bacteroidota bacterium]
MAIFDVDGTLYDQKRLRRRIIRDLLRHLIFKPHRWRDLLVIWKFRKEREKLSHTEHEDLATIQYDLAVHKSGVTADRAKKVIDYWMRIHPLFYLKDCRFEGVVDSIAHMKAKGWKVAVMSDFGAVDKIAALELEMDLIKSAEDKDIDQLKPDPKGFLRVARLLKTQPESCLVIGDRVEKDGIAAEKAGMQFFQAKSSSDFQQLQHLLNQLSGTIS